MSMAARRVLALWPAIRRAGRFLQSDGLSFIGILANRACHARFDPGVSFACYDAPGVVIEGDCHNLLAYCQDCFSLGHWDASVGDSAALDFLFELPGCYFGMFHAMLIGRPITVLM